MQRSVWVTADLQARHKHRRELATFPISILWVRRPDSGMNRQATLAVLASAIRDFDLKLASALALPIWGDVGWELPNPVKIIPIPAPETP